MLKRSQRLTTDFEYNISRKYGTQLKTPLFTIFWLYPRNYSGETKVGVVVSTRLDKKAVVRNRVKRVFTEVVRLNFDKLPPKLWLVVQPKRISYDKSYEEINSLFNQCLQEIPLA